MMCFSSGALEKLGITASLDKPNSPSSADEVEIDPPAGAFD